MRRDRKRAAAFAGAQLLVAMAMLAAMTAAAVVPAADPACGVLGAPRRLTVASSALPDSFTAARVGGIVVEEAVIGLDGSLSGLRVVRARIDALAPYARKSVQDSRFQPGSIEGNPVATRVQIATTIGTIAKARVEPEYDVVWAHVPAGVSREAAWQLAQSVDRVAVSAHVGTKLPEGGRIVAVAPDGKEHLLVRLPPSQAPVDVKQTVSAGKFFWKAGDYRLEVRTDGKTLAWTTLTIADDHTKAIVNACEPI